MVGASQLRDRQGKDCRANDSRSTKRILSIASMLFSSFVIWLFQHGCTYCRWRFSCSDLPARPSLPLMNGAIRSDVDHERGLAADSSVRHGCMVMAVFSLRPARLQRSDEAAKEKGGAARKSKPFWAMMAEGASHCGAGCTLGDICAEWLAFGIPALAVSLGWQSIFSEKIFAVWILDYIFAYAFGIVFQYYAIAPMRHLGVAQGVWAAVKADTLSLTSWQIGMYGFMAIANFWIFRDLLGVELRVDSVEFWFAMQIAMIFGFMTAYPVNWWLLKTGLKEKM